MKKLTLAALLGLSLSLSAQTPFLVRDLNSTRSSSVYSSSPDQFVADGGAVYFAATGGGAGRELWKFEGGQPSLVADLALGTGSSTPRSIARLRDGAIVFSAFVPPFGRELWVTDGTTGGTVLVKDIHPTGDGDPVVRAVSNGKVYFTATDGVNGREPWVSDGTEAGTRMLVNLDGGAGSPVVPVIAALGDRMLIFSRGGMWSTDGTPEGTTPIVPAGTLGAVSGFARIGGTGYFTATDAAGRELWKTDGTAAGTVRVKDIAAGPGSGITGSAQILALGGFVYFIASETASTFDLWRSDGTDGGTQKVKDVVATNTGATLYDDGTLLYLGTNLGVWRSDGTAGGTSVVDPSTDAVWLTGAFGGLYYVKTAGNTTELWATNGTVATTRRIRAFTNFSSPLSILTFTGGKLYFSVGDSLHGTEPWVCADADGAVVEMLANLNADGRPSSAPDSLTAAGDLVFFTAEDGLGLFRRELWRSDGSVAGTFRVTSLGDASNSPWLSLFTGWNGAFFFKHDSTGMYRSDGTEAGTGLFTNIRPSQVFPASSSLYFDSPTSSNSSLWRSDGTAAGTIDFGSGKITYARSFAELAGRVYINGGTSDAQLVVTQGTPESTKRVISFAWNEQPSTSLVTAAGLLFFGRPTQAAGNELWSSDGTLEGTVLVKDIAPGTASSLPQQLTGGARYLFFVADDGTHGAEVWRTDGTAEGTILLRDIAVGTTSSSPRELTVHGEVLYFVADDGIAGAELWRSDGTAGGTVMVADIAAGSGSSFVQNMSSSDGTLWFSAWDAVHGAELWRTNTAGGIEMVSDLEPGTGSSSPGKVVRAGGLLYFTADTSAFGSELWAMAAGSQPAVSIGDARVIEGNGGATIARFVLTRAGDTSATSMVTFTTADLSATAGADYVSSTGSVTFGAGVSTQFVDVLVNGDTLIEKNESFLVTLTGATGAVLRDASGHGVIEEDDRRAELTLELLGSGSSYHTVRITNNGPSMATNVYVRISHSPGKVRLCTSQTINPVDCGVANLAAGQSSILSINWSDDRATIKDVTTGTTVTAEVRAEETDTNLADNRVSHLVGRSMVLPAFLTNNAVHNATYRTSYAMERDTIVTIRSSSPAVVVSPSSIPIPPGQIDGAFTLTPQNFTGRVEVGGWWFGDTGSVGIASVEPGQTPKLDVAVWAPDVRPVYGEPANIAVEIAARRHDGTRPAGTVTLVDGSGATLAQQVLDGQASTTFVRNGVAPGMHDWKLHYSGDSNFNAITNVPVSVYVQSIPTETSLEIPPYFCGTADVVVRVRNKSGAEVPQGTVTVTVAGNTVATLTLASSGVPGEGWAKFQRTFSTNESYVTASFTPTSSTFATSSGSASVWVVNCAPFNFVATADGRAVTATWTAQPGADHYDLMYMYNPTNWVTATSTSGTSVTYTSFYDARVLLFAVRAVDAAGNALSYSQPDIVYTKRFTDDPLVSRATRVRSLHLTELQAAASWLRFLVEYKSLELPAVISGAPIRVARVLELREAINTYRMRLGLPAFSFTDPSLAVGHRVKAAHTQELRNALK